MGNRFPEAESSQSNPRSVLHAYVVTPYIYFPSVIFVSLRLSDSISAHSGPILENTVKCAQFLIYTRKQGKFARFRKSSKYYSCVKSRGPEINKFPRRSLFFDFLSIIAIHLSSTSRSPQPGLLLSTARFGIVTIP